MTFFDKHEKTFTRFATVFSKLFEIAYFIAAAGCVVALVLAAVDPAGFLAGVEPREEISAQGFSLVISNDQRQLLPGALQIFLIEAALSTGLMGMVFRNVNLVLRKSQDKTPFQKDNVRMLREIGFFFISIAVVQLIFCGVAVLVLGPDRAEVSAGAANFVTGLLMLCLSQCFALGVRMQQDVDGLV